MDKTVSDQADGLRRLMGAARGRWVSVVGGSPGAGATTVALDLAAALSRLGQEALLLDEHEGPRPASRACAQASITRGRWMSDVQRCTDGHGGHRPAILPASGAPAPGEARTLLAGRLVVIDAALDAAGGLSPLAAQADDVLVVLRPEPDALKSAYACIKALHRQHALGQLRLLFTQGADAALSGQLAANLVRTASQYLAVSLLPAGSVAADPHVAQARHLGRPVVDAFPASPAAADVRRLAAELLHWPLRHAPSRTPLPMPA